MKINFASTQMGVFHMSVFKSRSSNDCLLCNRSSPDVRVFFSDLVNESDISPSFKNLDMFCITPIIKV